MNGGNHWRGLADHHRVALPVRCGTPSGPTSYTARRGIIEDRRPVVLGAARPRPSRHTPDHPIPGDDAGPAARHTEASANHRLRGVIPVQSRTYEIIFSGQAGRTLRAQFDDCEVTTNPETTTLRAEVPDQAAFSGLVERIVGLGLEIIDVHLLTQPSLP